MQDIGVLRTPFAEPMDMPIQPSGARGTKGEAIIEDVFVEGLSDLDGFSHCILLYCFHKTGPAQLRVTPFLDTQPRGVFATRAPCRPNHIGLSVVRIMGVEENRVLLEDVDMLDGSPLLDIKPFVPSFDVPNTGSQGDSDAGSAVRIGWLEATHDDAKNALADSRFAQTK